MCFLRFSRLTFGGKRKGKGGGGVDVLLFASKRCELEACAAKGGGCCIPCAGGKWAPFGVGVLPL